MSGLSLLLRSTALSAALSLVAACGGGGGNDSDGATAANATAPSVNSNSSTSSTQTQAPTQQQPASPPVAQKPDPAPASPPANASNDIEFLPPVDETPSEGPANGAAILSWLAPDTDADGSALENVSSYRIRYGKQAGALDKTVEIKNPSVLTYTVENLTPGTWYFEVVAVNDDMEGPASNVGSKTVI